MNEKIVNAMAELDEDTLFQEVRKAMKDGTPGLEIINALQHGMTTVGEKFARNEYYISELIMSSELFKGCQEIIGKSDETSAPIYGTFVLGTVYGDIHDIGKNILSSVLSGNGFKVIDIGVDARPEKFIEAIREYDPKVVGLSCLLTTAFDSLKDCVQSIRKASLDKGRMLMIGGGPVDEMTREYCGADKYTVDAQSCFLAAKDFVTKS